METVQGFILLDVDVAALNNAGSDKSSNLDNAVVTKKIWKNGKAYPYVSGQAWRYWWRDTLAKSFDWEMSPVIREKKIAYTQADPFRYPDDDLFGYMRAEKKDTLTRVSPLKNSALIALSPNPIVQNWAAMTRQDGDAVPFGIDEYCATLKGMFSIDLDQVGTFSMANRTGFMNINESMKKTALEDGCVEMDDPLSPGDSKTAGKLVRMPVAVREKRVKEAVLALKMLSGGAKQTTNMVDVTPKLIVLTRFKGGNHPFSHLGKEELGKPVFSIEALVEILEDFKDQFMGDIFIGKRKGFMDDLDGPLREIADKRVKTGPVNAAIEGFVNTLALS
ncbi:MAG: type I-B CRISPR-associated protein Cas7/Cst2/DevR [Desulfobacterales bacterium]|nr:type I-B CRISPR-associated protein Cas7/Cst2/DevR [Desulfobacterales bacterium]